jgi:hypothetical protein
MKLYLLILAATCVFAAQSANGQNTVTSNIFTGFAVTMGIEKGISFKWTVSNESQIQQYEIQQGNAITGFKTIAVIFTEDAAAKEKAYSFDGKLLFGGKAAAPAAGNQYRIKFADTEGNVSYSSSAEVTATGAVACK